MTDLALGVRKEPQDLRVVVDGLVEAAVVALHNLINSLFHHLALVAELQQAGISMRSNGSMRKVQKYISRAALLGLLLCTVQQIWMLIWQYVCRSRMPAGLLHVYVTQQGQP